MSRRVLERPSAADLGKAAGEAYFESWWRCGKSLKLANGGPAALDMAPRKRVVAALPTPGRTS